MRRPDSQLPLLLPHVHTSPHVNLNWRLTAHTHPPAGTLALGALFRFPIARA